VPRAQDEITPLFQPRMIPRGLGRSYGDAAILDAGTVMLTERLDRIISFDKASGILRAESGVALSEVIARFLPLGWFPMVTPGTKFVTLGGCVAADVHGKNHHRDGSFGEHVSDVQIALADGRVVNCSPDHLPDLFWSAVGGMGLTGVITQVELALRPVESAFLNVRHRAAANLSALFHLFEDDQFDDHYTVAWIDCVKQGEAMGRGIYMSGHHASATEVERYAGNLLEPVSKRTLTARFGLPGFAFGRTSASIFNELYFRVQSRKAAPFLSDYDSFFYPLDRIKNWNVMYGKKGFVQYQCVIPTASAREGMQSLMNEIVRSGHASMLGVLKRFGDGNPGFLSFPVAGYTLAIDFPIGHPGLFTLLDRLDAITIDHGGRVYLAKDARLSRSNFARMYPMLPQWMQIKSNVDPAARFTSDLARRVGLT
jgi:FAD/FMN-containing dehydrogenase